MSRYTRFYRGLADRVGLTESAWNGNRVKGRGRHYLSDGIILLRVSRCDPERLERWGLYQSTWLIEPELFADESVARAVLDGAVDEATEGVGPEPDAWGEIRYEPIVGYRVGDLLVPFNARKLRLAAYVTHAEEMTAAVDKAAVLWRGGEPAALVMPLHHADAPVEWDDAAEEGAA